MKPSIYTLVHQPAFGPARKAAHRQQDQLFQVRMSRPRLAESLKALRPDLRLTLLNAAFSPEQEDTGLAGATINSLSALLDRLEESRGLTTVGVWDVDACVPGLLPLIEAFNAAQGSFVFFQVHASVPAGLVTPPARIRSWAAERLGRKLTSEEAAEIVENVIADDFFGRAEAVRKDLGVDYLVGAVAARLAGVRADGDIYWNYFARYDDRQILVSSADLRAYASQAGRPVEVAVALLLLTGLLVAMNHPRLDYRQVDNGTLFDRNMDRVSLIPILREPRIDPADLKKIPPRHRQAAEALVEVLRTYPGRGQP